MVETHQFASNIRKKVDHGPMGIEENLARMLKLSDVF